MLTYTNTATKTKKVIVACSFQSTGEKIALFPDGDLYLEDYELT